MTNEQTAVLLAGWVRRLEWCLCKDYEKEVRGQYEDLRLSLSAAIMEIKEQVVMLSRPSGALSAEVYDADGNLVHTFVGGTK